MQLSGVWVGWSGSLSTLSRSTRRGFEDLEIAQLGVEEVTQRWGQWTAEHFNGEHKHRTQFNFVHFKCSGQVKAKGKGGWSKPVKLHQSCQVAPRT